MATARLAALLLRRGAPAGSALHTGVPSASCRLTSSYVQGTLDIPLLTKTMGQCLDETAERFPDRDALVFCRDGVRKTFAQFKEEVDQAAAGLLALGLKKGDRLGMWGPNKYEWVLMQFATAQAGIILVSVNPAYQALELEFVIRKVGCKALVFPTQFKTQKYYDILKQSCPELEKSTPGGIKSKRLPNLSVVITMDSKLPGTFHMDEVMQAGDSSHMKQLRAVQQTLACNEPINIQFTSGTTGSPKGATLSHRNIVNNANLIGLRLGITEQDYRVGLPAPLYHCLASVGGCMVMALHGSSCIFSSPSFEGKAALEAVSQEKCSFLHGTPTMFIDMLSQPDFDSYDLSSLRGGKSDSSNGKILRNWILLAPCWEAVLSFVSKSLFWREEFCCTSLVFHCYVSFPWGFLQELCIFNISFILKQIGEGPFCSIGYSRELNLLNSGLTSHHRAAADALCALGWCSP
ncbi:medium-chain acyl-CoA ligase ACSF2, mitochondrial isoform X1 [Grus americana]|uniref:medium-chain acyl-CoA ligase ACSF2, mitochondrial isoform X1 n=1 Tax=Grus americana TaxID=9117 RepID=UPI0024080DF6|nr:medium-chain acyl-CoA ligase ACSF2, mitochondrial isoform X1 [Grus americana]